MPQAQRTADASMKIAEALTNPFHSPNLGPASHFRDNGSERALRKMSNCYCHPGKAGGTPKWFSCARCLEFRDEPGHHAQTACAPFPMTAETCPAVASVDSRLTRATALRPRYSDFASSENCDAGPTGFPVQVNDLPAIEAQLPVANT